MDIIVDHIIFQSQILESSYPASHISYLDTNCINFIHRGEANNRDYFFVNGLGKTLFPEYPCLKLGDLWPMIQHAGFIVISNESNEITALINPKNVMSVVGKRVYFKDSYIVNLPESSNLSKLAKAIQQFNHIK